MSTDFCSSVIFGWVNIEKQLRRVKTCINLDNDESKPAYEIHKFETISSMERVTLNFQS